MASEAPPKYYCAYEVLDGDDGARHLEVDVEQPFDTLDAAKAAALADRSGRETLFCMVYICEANIMRPLAWETTFPEKWLDHDPTDDPRW